MDIHELRQFESVYKPSKEVAFCWLRKQYVQLSTEENHTEIVDHANDSLRIWQAAKAQAVPKWISVEEALPPENILVLAIAQTFSNVFNVYNVMALDEFQESDITHWMPLPDAPQEPAND